jgi:hypothetical protein
VVVVVIAVIVADARRGDSLVGIEGFVVRDVVPGRGSA